MDDKPDELEQAGLVWIGLGTWQVVLDYVVKALSEHGIEYFCHGSRIYGIYVDRDDAERAKEVLRQDAKKNGYKVDLVE